MLARRNLAVVSGDSRPRATAPTVAQQGEIRALMKPQVVFVDFEDSELNEMVSAAARAELAPGLVPERSRQFGHRPVLVHHSVLAWCTECRSDSEPCLSLDGLFKALALPFQGRDRKVEHRKLHATGDVDTYSVGNDRVSSRKDAT